MANNYTRIQFDFLNLGDVSISGEHHEMHNASIDASGYNENYIDIEDKTLNNAILKIIKKLTPETKKAIIHALYSSKLEEIINKEDML